MVHIILNDLDYLRILAFLIKFYYLGSFSYMQIEEHINYFNHIIHTYFYIVLDLNNMNFSPWEDLHNHHNKDSFTAFIDMPFNYMGSLVVAHNTPHFITYMHLLFNNYMGMFIILDLDLYCKNFLGPQPK